MKDLFTESIDSLIKGLTSIIPGDDPTIKFMRARAALAEYKKQADKLYAEIGEMALARDGDEAYGKTAETLRELLTKIDEAQAIIDAAKGARKDDPHFSDMVHETECPSCGHTNPAEAKFCIECGAKLGPVTCPSCGHINPPGTKFCGQCGTQL
jgi:ribosomal protein L40E